MREDYKVKYDCQHADGSCSDKCKYKQINVCCAACDHLDECVLDLGCACATILDDIRLKEVKNNAR